MDNNRVLVRIAEMAVVTSQSGAITTHALGSCIGLSVFDPVARVGGMLHFMLPSPATETSASRIDVGPHAYGSTAVPALFRAAYALGADKERLIVCAAGGADRLGGENGLRIGARNWAMLRKLLWKNGINVAAHEVGGDDSRNMTLDLSTGAVDIVSGGQTTRLHLPEAA